MKIKSIAVKHIHVLDLYLLMDQFALKITNINND